MGERENETASLISLTVPLVIWMMRTGVLRAWFGLIVLGTLLYTVMLTGSNTGLLTFVLGVVLMQLASPRPFREFTLLIAAGSAVVVTVMFFGEAILPEIFVKRVYGALSTGDLSQAGTVVGRLNLNFEALRIAHDNLLIGQGMDQYRLQSAYGAPVHNAYLLLLNEGGAFTVIGLLMIFLGVATVGLVLIAYPESRVTGLYLLVTITLFAMAISAAAHVYGRFWVTTWLVALSLALTAERPGGSLASKMGPR